MTMFFQYDRKRESWQHVVVTRGWNLSGIVVAAPLSPSKEVLEGGMSRTMLDRQRREEQHQM